MYEEGTALLYLWDTFRRDDKGYISSYSLEEVMAKINRAPPEIRQYLKGRCPTEEHLEEYLNSYEENYFWVENGRMTLNYPTVQEGHDKAVSYFEDILDTYEIRPKYKNLYGHIGQADDDVLDYMWLFYRSDFKQFLLNHSDVFVVFTDDTVSLQEKEAAKYFQQRLREGREGWHYKNLRGCIGQAPKYIINFINEYYPDEEFLQFLENNSYYFHVDEEEYVYLN